MLEAMKLMVQSIFWFVKVEVKKNPIDYEKWYYNELRERIELDKKYGRLSSKYLELWFEAHSRGVTIDTLKYLVFITWPVVCMALALYML